MLGKRKTEETRVSFRRRQRWTAASLQFICKLSVSFSQTTPRTVRKTFLLVEGTSSSVLWIASALFTHWGFKASIDPETMATKR